ncbi:MAG TPA: M1 family aminopeptidase [Bryobacteraceae bacterium]|nr:M1 family aminopeptidase [Bryobacteraceae bacterium]
MVCNRGIVLAYLALASLAALSPAAAQERKNRIDVEHYTIEAEIDPRTQTLTATVQVRFIPLEDNTSTVSFELNNALNVSRIVDAGGRQIPASRSQQDFSVRLNFPEPLPKGKPTTLTFSYDGKLTGNEESPVYGIKFAAIKSDNSFLLYPARWFPVNDYTADRYTADMRIVVPAAYKVIASGTEDKPDRAAGDKISYRFRFNQSSFPGSIAVLQGEAVRASSQGVTTLLYFHEQKEMANAYGEEIGKIMSYLTSVFGLPPQASLTVVETDSGTPNGYSAPGILFLSPRAIGKQVNPRLLANQVARQWWGSLVSPATRNHLWIQNGAARYSEFLYLEHVNGAAALDAEVRDAYIEALTVDNVPLIQSARLEDYSPEYWAATSGKGAAVYHMLRGVMGDDKFGQLLKTITDKYAWKSITTENFRKLADEVAGQNLQFFFIQWIESSGAPEFKLDYTVFRTQKGFRVMGKIAQDLDTFRMPVELKIETEGNPEDKRVEVVGTSSEFMVDTFGKPKKVVLDPANRVLRFSNPIRVAVAIRKGEQFAEVGEFTEALKEYQKALDVSRNSSLAHYRVAEVFMLQNNYQSAANEFREALNGDLQPQWTEVWSHINLGKIFDITGQRERAVNEYQLAARTKDNSQNAQEEAAKYLKQPYERKKIEN